MTEVLTSVLDRVNSPSDLKGLSIQELTELSSEMRELIIKKVNTTGGHFGPNLGMVEATVAMHYVFNSPVDKFVFDVSHQCYPHKILTGRKEGFTNPDMYHYYTGYTAPEESAHDYFKVGHTSTAVSLATGLAKARDLKGDNENVVAIVGDGSLTGGEALEGLNNAAALGSNIIVVVNDNDMSIAENHGGIYDNLRLLRETNGKAELNFFKSLGFDYYYINDGHDIESMIETFTKVKDANHPVLVHLHTIKGKGFKPAELDRESFHWIMPGTLDNLDKPKPAPTESYESITADFLLKKASEDKTVVAITPATPGVSGFTKDFRAKMGKQYVDVGIAEEHAVAFASGIAKNGGKPVLAIMSSFIQRTYDQLSQDLALNNNPATILVFWGGITGMDATHLSSFDISMVSNIPNLVYLAPSNKEEYLKMLDWSIDQNEHPVVIRVPFAPVQSQGEADNTNYSELNKYKFLEKGSEVALVGLGTALDLAKRVKAELLSKCGISATLINPCYATGVDSNLLEGLKSGHKLVVTMENGILSGGFGEKITRFYGNSDMRVLNYGALKEFTDRVPLEELMERYRLREDLIVEDIKKVI